ncbi:YbbR-like domain-containing protein [Mesonia ostreae]|uniref:YbbR-like domain-containing protein n=1 Tax=Mesonia ostreae TaxID=861110 RepID=A0ABU2KLH3_9FLAO|nr:YbbR-like domain-containing protein [Mesonia ostreae]MDT0295582.1 YbbR-like domain-containing protein [Mesonia ostreae]
MLKEQIQRLNRTTFKKINFKAFFFFFFFAMLIWLLIQFSKTYTKDVLIPIQFNDIPKDKIVERTQASIKLRVTENGFVLAWLSIRNPSMMISLEELPIIENNLIYQTENAEADILSMLRIDYDNVRFITKTIKIPFIQKETKVVPVIPDIEVSYAPGYNSDEQFLIQPDSIEISGAKKVLDSIHSISTQKLILKNVSANTKGVVEVDTTTQSKVTYYQHEVEYFLKTKKFTEGRLNIPIEILNAPKDASVSIFPKEVIVIYTVSLDGFEMITKNDFVVVCDFDDLSENQNFLIPKIQKKPSNVTAIRLNINKVQFVLKK